MNRKCGVIGEEQGERGTEESDCRDRMSAVDDHSVSGFGSRQRFAETRQIHHRPNGRLGRCSWPAIKTTAEQVS